MEFASYLTQAVLLKRSKRFLAEVVINNQEHRIIYCPNMSAMTGCDALGSRVWFSHSQDPRRKYPDTWELIEIDTGLLVCINTQHANGLVLEGIESGVIKELQGYAPVTLESSILGGDYCLEMVLEKQLQSKSSENGYRNTEKCFVDVKCVTLGDEIHRGFFPDTPSDKAVQQLTALIHAKELGYRAMLIYCVQHPGIDRLFPADHIDFNYGNTIRQAVSTGVEIVAYRVDISLEGMHIAKPIEMCIPARLISSSRS